LNNVASGVNRFQAKLIRGQARSSRDGVTDECLWLQHLNSSGTAGGVTRSSCAAFGSATMSMPSAATHATKILFSVFIISPALFAYV
jgi:hypothetical protein